MLRGRGVLGDRCFLAVDVLIPAESAVHVVAAERAGAALGGERFGPFPFLLGEGADLARVPSGAGVGGGGEQSRVGAG